MASGNGGLFVFLVLTLGLLGTGTARAEAGAVDSQDENTIADESSADEVSEDPNDPDYVTIEVDPADHSQSSLYLANEVPVNLADTIQNAPGGVVSFVANLPFLRSWQDEEIRDFPDLGVTVPQSGLGFTYFLYGLRQALADTGTYFEASQSFYHDGVAYTRRSFAEKVFAEEGLPKSLIWIAAQEGRWRNHPRENYAGASGWWQFIKKTAVDYFPNGNVPDMRHDFNLSTRAAAKYLKTIYLGDGKNQLDWKADWSLVIAAYNHGEGEDDYEYAEGQSVPYERMSKAVRDTGGHRSCDVRTEDGRLVPVSRSGGFCETNGYWRAMSHTPGQTQQYVPYVLAWARVAITPRSELGDTSLLPKKVKVRVNKKKHRHRLDRTKKSKKKGERRRGQSARPNKKNKKQASTRSGIGRGRRGGTHRR
jgi:hypothetical protein